MKASIILTTYNREGYFRKAFDSAVHQDMKSDDYEVIVIEDGSNYVPKVMANYIDLKNVRVIQQNNRGRSAAVNRGMSIAQGDYLTLLDDDDIILPCKLLILSKWLDDHPEYQMVCSMGKGINSAGQQSLNLAMSWQLLAKKHGITLERVLRGNYINGVSTMYRAKNLGRFDESLITAEEYDFHLRILHEGKKIGFVEEYTGLYRFHTNNKSVKIAKSRNTSNILQAIRQRYT